MSHNNSFPLAAKTVQSNPYGHRSSDYENVRHEKHVSDKGQKLRMRAFKKTTKMLSVRLKRSKGSNETQSLSKILCKVTRSGVIPGMRFRPKKRTKQSPSRDHQQKVTTSKQRNISTPASYVASTVASSSEDVRQEYIQHFDENKRNSISLDRLQNIQRFEKNNRGSLSPVHVHTVERWRRKIHSVLPRSLPYLSQKRQDESVRDSTLCRSRPSNLKANKPKGCSLKPEAHNDTCNHTAKEVQNIAAQISSGVHRPVGSSESSLYNMQEQSKEGKTEEEFQVTPSTDRHFYCWLHGSPSNESSKFKLPEFNSEPDKSCGVGHPQSTYVTSGEILSIDRASVVLTSTSLSTPISPRPSSAYNVISFQTCIPRSGRGFSACASDTDSLPSRERLGERSWLTPWEAKDNISVASFVTAADSFDN